MQPPPKPIASSSCNCKYYSLPLQIPSNRHTWEKGATAKIRMKLTSGSAENVKLSLVSCVLLVGLDDEISWYHYGQEFK